MSASSTIPDEVALRRMIAKSDKFVAGQRELVAESEKFSAEQRKLMAEGHKLDRERRLAPLLAWVGLIGVVVTVTPVTLRALGVHSLIPDRLRELLALLSWSQQGLAQALECDPRLAQRWASEQAPTPPSVGAWLEALSSAHQAHPPPQNWRVRRMPMA